MISRHLFVIGDDYFISSFDSANFRDHVLDVESKEGCLTLSRLGVSQQRIAEIARLASTDCFGEAKEAVAEAAVENQMTITTVRLPAAPFTDTGIAVLTLWAC